VTTSPSFIKPHIVVIEEMAFSLTTVSSNPYKYLWKCLMVLQPIIQAEEAKSKVNLE